MKNSIAVIILTYNEELNIKRCINNVKKLTDKIYIIDSFSTDKTCDIAKELGCKIYQHTFENQAKQLNWALENINIREEWVLRLDADEYLTDELIKEIKEKLPKLRKEINGVFIKRRIYFMGKWMKRGIYPVYVMRLWRNKKAICENRWMDEHMKLLEGKTTHFNYDFIDDDKKNLTTWINKHNNYASREAIEYLIAKYKIPVDVNNIVQSNLFGTQEQRKKWFKNNIYLVLPLGVRPVFYFFYRYFLRLGFLDGFRGFLFHSMQGFWYRLLVDAKIYEIEKKMKESDKNIKQIIEEEFGYKL